MAFEYEYIELSYYILSSTITDTNKATFKLKGQVKVSWKYNLLIAKFGNVILLTLLLSIS
jgi:hypothetical protein